MTDRITQIKIQGFRSLADVTLDLSGLTVLIGDNGSGKSAIIEVCETLRYFAESGASLQQYFEEHPSPVRTGGSTFSVTVQIESDEPKRQPRLQYGFTVQHKNHGLAILNESLTIGPEGTGKRAVHAIERKASNSRVFTQSQGKLVRVEADPMRMLLSSLGSAPRWNGDHGVEQRAIDRVSQTLRNIEVHVPFEVVPAWVSRRSARRSAARESSMLQPATRLELLATNLSNVYHSLKNDFGAAHWGDTLEYVRMGLGADVDDVSPSADAAGGQQAISVRFKSLPSPIPAAALSDGSLAYLAFVAMLRLPSTRTLLAFDEPELHTHPGLLARVVSMLEEIALACPVLVTAHSDRFLDSLLDPAASTVLCQLDAKRATRLLRPEPGLLKQWLADFQGLGDLRGSGLESAVMEVREPRRKLRHKGPRE